MHNVNDQMVWQQFQTIVSNTNILCAPWKWNITKILMFYYENTIQLSQSFLIHYENIIHTILTIHTLYIAIWHSSYTQNVDFLMVWWVLFWHNNLYPSLFSDCWYTAKKVIIQFYFAFFLYNSCIPDFHIYWFEYQNFQF